jgi:hypothetical protein
VTVAGVKVEHEVFEPTRSAVIRSVTYQNEPRSKAEAVHPEEPVSVSLPRFDPQERVMVTGGNCDSAIRAHYPLARIQSLTFKPSNQPPHYEVVLTSGGATILYRIRCQTTHAGDLQLMLLG